MHPKSSRWKAITPSAFDHEREALEWVREQLPDWEPWRAWSNFEFSGHDGSMNEVDLLVLSPAGLFVVEIKSWRGRIQGDAGTWTLHFDGRTKTVDNPLSLTNLKAKRLKSLLLAQPSLRGQWTPFFEPVIFLSATDLQTEFDADGRKGVFARDGRSDHSGLPGLKAHLTGEDVRHRGDRRIKTTLAKRLEEALEQAGVRPSQRHRKVGDYTLEELLYDGQSYQDWRARHGAFDGDLERRIRIYVTANAPGSEERQTLERAAKREFFILQGIDHAGILKARDYKQHELGPALIFDHFPEAQRLDHLLAEDRDLDVERRLHLLRELAETLKFAHSKRLFHRALSPHSVLIRRPGDIPKPVIFNWQTGVREASSTFGGRAVTATVHPDQLVESAAGGYMAPEIRLGSSSDDAAADIFSLGAIAYHLFAGRPAAETQLELVERLRQQNGLRLSASTDGVPPALEELVAQATAPVVSDRLATADQFLSGLDQVWDELTRPDDEPAEKTAPAETARKGDALGGGWTVVRRLGQGGSSYVFLAENDGTERVLKVARSAEHDDVLLDEAAVLQQLRHHLILEFYDVAEIGGRTALVLSSAGKETLAERLRKDGPLSLDLLQRWGEDLLSTVHWLEQKGLPHRDLKPDNLGIQEVGKNRELHLVLFDFSLSRTPAESFQAGTPPYLDPFIPLRKEDGNGQARWDLAAERFAAAVTLYEMATHRTPTWGDGKTDPAFVEDEANLATEHFFSSVREGLAAFFRRALRRDARERFDNADEMLRAWRRIFDTADQPVVPTSHPEGDAADSPANPLELVQPDSQVIELELSKRAFHALEKLGIESVRDLLAANLFGLQRMRGVGTKTRDEIVAATRFLRGRFGGEAAETPYEAATDETEDTSSATQTAEPADAEGPLDLEVLAQRLVPAGRRKSAARPAVRRLLGLEPGEPWPSQSDVARHEGVTRARIGQILAKQRKLWRALAPLDTVCTDLESTLETQGGVVTAEEAVEILAASHPSVPDASLRAVVRAAWEAEGSRETSRWQVHRRGDRIFLALDADDERPGPPSTALADWAAALGEEADRLASRDPLPAAATVVESLRAMAPPEGAPTLSSARLVRLAAAASEAAAVSGRLELYPRNLSARRALRLAGGVVIGSQQAKGNLISADALRDRVAHRYPAAESLPGRPELDELLASEGFKLSWSDEDEAYRLPLPPGLPSTTATLSRRSYRPAVQRPAAEQTFETFEQRLEQQRRSGGLLLLLADHPLAAARDALLDRFEDDDEPLQPLNLDAVFLRHLREVAEARRVKWQVVLQADAAAEGSRNWNRLVQLVDLALPSIEDDVLARDGHVLLEHPGLLARYDRLGLLERWRDALSRPAPTAGDRRLRTLWALVHADEQGERPRLDGKVIPVISDSDWLRVPRAWAEPPAVAA